jgi:hypothetical protein
LDRQPEGYAPRVRAFCKKKIIFPEWSFKSGMSQIISRVSKKVRRKGAERYLWLYLLSFSASVTFTRFFLMATGYPQLGNETLHIAHVLYGGVLLHVGSILPLIYANRWVYNWSGVLSGVGFGLFIDEVGKFITQSNDYFFPAAAPIIYAVFLISVLIYTRVSRETPLDARTELYAVLESLEEAIDHEMDPEEHNELIERLKRIKEKEPNTDLGLLSDHILEFVDSEAIHVAHDEPSLYGKAIDRFRDLEGRWLSQSRLRIFIIVGLSLFGLAGGIRLIYYTTGGPAMLESLLRERVAELPVVTSASLFWAAVQLAMEGLVGLILLISAALLIFGKEKIGFWSGSIGLVVYLVGVNLIQFYIDQFATVVKAFVQFLILHTMYYYQRRFRIR